MSYNRSLVIIAFVAMIALILGCSGGGNPIAPDKSSESLDSAPIIGLTDTNDTFNAVGLMGAYELYIDPADISAELVNKRVSSIGEDYIVSGISFFTIAPCASCLKIIGISLTPGGVATLTFAIDHPFPPGNTSEPPTAANRLDLDVFDLAAVLYPGGDPAPVPTTYTLTGAGVYTEFCVDPDGFTCELADVVGDDAALPYFLVVDDYAGDPPAATFNKFAMGDTGSFDVGFDLTSGSLRFEMYLTMGYGFSAKKPDRLSPKYYNPEFNRKAAWKVVVTPPQGTDPPVIGNTWQDNDTTTLFNVAVDVYDWQIGATVSAEADFADAAIDEVFAASEPASVTVEVPGMNPTTLPEATTPDDPLADPWTFTVGVANENGLPAGEYLGLVKVTDARAVLTPGDGRDFLIDTPDGILLDNYSMPEYATYQTFPATVVVGCGPITLDSLTGCPTAPISNGTIIPFALTAHSDNGGGTVHFEVDTDYDGSTFVPDVLYPMNDTGIFNVLVLDDPCVVGTHHDIAFRLTDDCTPPNVVITDVCDVEIGECASYQELYYDFQSGCTDLYNCEGWVCGGCGLPNTGMYNYGRFKFSCNVGTICSDMVFPYITSGGDYTGCSWMTDYYQPQNNVVSPDINLPSATDSEIEFDYCGSMYSTAHFRLYYTEDGDSCSSASWTSLNDTHTNGCQLDTTIDISAVSGSHIMFRFELYDTNYQGSAGSCGTAGITLDNIRISGTFAGSLAEN